MKHKTLLLSIALLAPLALRAQTSTSSTSAPLSSAPSGQSARGANEQSLDDNPDFKRLPPDQQQWVRQMAQRLDKAVAEKDSAAIDQLAKETAAHMKGLDSPAPAPTYHYRNGQPDNAAVSNPPPAKPAPSSPCVVVPKKPGVLGKLKQHLESTLKAQAAKADAQIGKASHGNVDGPVLDTTTTAVNEANQPGPCPPVKGQAAKQ